MSEVDAAETRTVVETAAARSVGPVEEAEIRHVGVFQVWGLGDLVMTLPVIDLLRRVFPEAKLTVVVRGAAQESLLQGSALGLNVIAMPPRRSIISTLRFLLDLRRQSMDVAFIATRTTPALAVLLRALSGIHEVVGDSESFRWLYSHCGEVLNTEHRVVRMLRTACDWIGIHPTKPRFPLPIGDAGRRVGDTVLKPALLSPKNFLVIHPGSGRGRGFENKRLPARLIRHMIDWLRGNHPDVGIAVVFGPDEDDLRKAFSDLPNGVSQLSGLSLDEVKGLLREARGFVGGDTGLGHVAAALGVPTLTVAGPTNVTETAPFSVDATVVGRVTKLPCQPCWNTRLHGRCPIDSQCMRDIELAQVTRVVGRWLRSTV